MTKDLVSRLRGIIEEKQNEIERLKREIGPKGGKIRSLQLREKISKLLAEMLASTNEHGNYRTSRFIWQMEDIILTEIDQLKKEKENDQLKDFTIKNHQLYGKVCEILSVPLDPEAPVEDIVRKFYDLILAEIEKVDNAVHYKRETS